MGEKEVSPLKRFIIWNYLFFKALSTFSEVFLCYIDIWFLTHYEIYCCKPVLINLHQKTCTNNLNHASTMHKPVINLYHKQVHQPCTNLYHKQVHPTMYQSSVNYSSTMTHQYVPTSSTIHLMYVSTHQLLVSTMYSTCTSTKSPHQFHHKNLICSSIIDLVYMITFLQTCLNLP